MKSVLIVTATNTTHAKKGGERSSAAKQYLPPYSFPAHMYYTIEDGLDILRLHMLHCF